MSNYTAPKDNVVFIGPHIAKTDNNPQRAKNSPAFSEPAITVPIHTCGNTKHSISKYQDLMSDLSQLDAGQMNMSQLQKRWAPEFQSFHSMRYTRTGPKGKNTRHSAFDTFPSFLFHVGPKNHPDDTLDRIDHSNPEYGPDLVRWASKGTQSHNRSNVKTLTDSQHNSYSIAEWSRKTGLSESTIRARLKAGKTPDEALYTPTGGFSRESTSAPTTGHYLRLWKTLLIQHHGQKFFEPGGKECKQLQLVVDALAKGKVGPDEALDLIVSDWYGFTRYAEREYGAWQKAPNVPTVAYLHANIQAAGNFYQQRDDDPNAAYLGEPKGIWDE
jgi:hypothetical protein